MAHIRRLDFLGGKFNYIRRTGISVGTGYGGGGGVGPNTHIHGLRLTSHVQLDNNFFEFLLKILTFCIAGYMRCINYTIVTTLLKHLFQQGNQLLLKYVYVEIVQNDYWMYATES